MLRHSFIRLIYADEGQACATPTLTKITTPSRKFFILRAGADLEIVQKREWGGGIRGTS